MKKIIFIILVILIGVLGFIFINKPNKVETKKEIKEVKKDVLEDVVLENKVVITNVNLVYQEGVSTFSAKIKNLTSDTLKYNHLEIIASVNKENITLIGYFGGEIKPENEVLVTAQTNYDLAKADKLSYKLN